MKRFFTGLVVLISVIGFVVVNASAAEKAAEKKALSQRRKLSSSTKTLWGS